MANLGRIGALAVAAVQLLVAGLAFLFLCGFPFSFHLAFFLTYCIISAFIPLILAAGVNEKSRAYVKIWYIWEGVSILILISRIATTIYFPSEEWQVELDNYIVKVCSGLLLFHCCSIILVIVFFERMLMARDDFLESEKGLHFQNEIVIGGTDSARNQRVEFSTIV